MSVQFYPNGIGGKAPGDVLDLAKPLQTTGNVWYVSFTVGVDAVAPAGQNREKPLKTIAQAITNAANDDFIVFLPGHAETLVAVQLISKRLTFIGEGITNGKPSVKFTNGATSGLFSATAAGVEFRNIYFPEGSVNNAGSKLNWSAARGRIRGCLFECGANDVTFAALSLNAGADQLRIEGSTFISVATSTASQPACAIRGGLAINDLEITDTTISAGPFGFSNYYAVDLSGAAALRCRFTNLSLLLGADVNMGANATGDVNVALATGGSRVAWG